MAILATPVKRVDFEGSILKLFRNETRSYQTPEEDKRFASGFPGACGDVRIAVRVRTALPLPHSLRHRLDYYRCLPGPRTLDCAPP